MGKLRVVVYAERLGRRVSRRLLGRKFKNGNRAVLALHCLTFISNNTLLIVEVRFYEKERTQVALT